MKNKGMKTRRKTFREANSRDNEQEANEWKEIKRIDKQ